MKGTYFQKGTEFRLQTEAESWSQGDTIRGTLVLRAHSPGVSTTARVVLAHGNLKQVHAKKADALDAVEEVVLSGKELTNESGAAWSFSTSLNARITDSTTSLFLLYGPEGGGLETLGHLQVTLKPAPVIEKFLDVLKTRFRFVLKTMRSEKKGCQAKLVPPDSSALAFVDQVVIHFHFDEEVLNLAYEFTTHGFEAGASSVKQTKQKKTREVEFRKSDYLTSSGRLNDDLFEKEIEAALVEIGKK